MGPVSDWLCVSKDQGGKFLVCPLFLSLFPILFLLTKGQPQSENPFCTPRIFYELNVSHIVAAAAAKSLQSCPTLCDPTDGSPPGSPVPGILWARTLEWVAISVSNA